MVWTEPSHDTVTPTLTLTHPNPTLILPLPPQAGPQRREVTARLLVDCMGHYSPIVKQMRGGAKPHGMVLVVGTCADGVPADQNRCPNPNPYPNSSPDTVWHGRRRRQLRRWRARRSKQVCKHR